VTTVAQKLRRQSTLSERRMWALLHPFRDRGYHFRKQVQIGTYVADFACHHAMLIMGVDGEQHGTPTAQANDALRDDYFRGRGFRVIRIPSVELFGNEPGVYSFVESALAHKPPRVRNAPLPSSAKSLRS
jgi:very-short-patch-repair endonuclease